VDTRFAGLDATKDVIEVSVRPTGEVWTTNTSDEGIAEMAKKLRRIQPDLVAMQATGNFELPVAATLATVGLPFALIHPRHIREFARAIGRTSRLDRGHAGLLAHYAELVRPEAWSVPDELIEQLKELKTRRREVVQMVTLERSRMKRTSPVVQKDLQSHVLFLEKSLTGIDEQFSRTIRSSRLWR
jgi:transposase